MDDIISDAAVRLQKSLHRMSGGEVCHCCGEADPRCLEWHHIAGQANHGDVVPICRNCHRKLSDMQRDHPANSAQSMVEVIGHYLLGLADFFLELAQRLKEFGQILVSGTAVTAEAV